MEFLASVVALILTVVTVAMVPDPGAVVPGGIALFLWVLAVAGTHRYARRHRLPRKGRHGRD